jgi:hypothetical protein
MQVMVLRLKGVGGGDEDKEPDPSQWERWVIKWLF